VGSSRIVSNVAASGPTHSSRWVEPAIRAPRASDAAAVWALVQETPALDANSAYAYLLLCTDFAATGAVAEADDELVGFVLGYRPPTRPEAYFVWQIAVRENQRGRGLGRDLLHAVLAQTLARGVSFLEATVTPSNRASRSLFAGFANRIGAPCREVPVFPSELFPDGRHEREILLRIGPLAADALS